jgi:peptidoglycan/LPS O-acetylase OafA/YrhL
MTAMDQRILNGRDGASGQTRRQWRTDITGLRTVAVLPVLIFHAFPNLLPGGFVGVDIFFVISGFLITGIINRECEENRFSILGFYERRFKRILPPFALMAVVSTVAAVLILPPTELALYGKNLAASALFSANIAFYKQSGYFAPNSDDNPLLHMWSLAVEEQFYIFWPLVIFLGLRFLSGRNKVIASIALIVLGLAAAEIAARLNPSAAFYLPHLRAWELLLGALLAFVQTKPQNPTTRTLLTFVGAALIVTSFAFYNGGMRFPGLSALAPCLGTALLIYAGGTGDTPVERLLSTAPFQVIGYCSYALYLWHWPLLVLWRVRLNVDHLGWVALVPLLISLALSYFSWRVIERPIQSSRVSRTKVLIASLATLGLFAAIGAVLYLGKGLPARVPAGVRAAERLASEKNTLREACHVHGAKPSPIAGCLSGAPGARASLMLWGDSHADSIAPGLGAIAGQHGLTMRQASKSGCAPLLDVTQSVVGNTDEQCVAFNHAVIAEIERSPDIKYVVIAARWPLYGGQSTTVGGGSMSLQNASKTTGGAQGNLAVLKLGLTRSIAAARAANNNAQIIVLGPMPEQEFSVSSCVARARMANAPDSRCVVSSEAKAKLEATEHLLSAIAREDGVTVVYPSQVLCSGGRCTFDQDGAIVLGDNSHVTPEGAKIIARKLLGPIFEIEDLKRSD